MVGATCMVFGQTVLHAQIERDNMIFATNGSWKSGKSLDSEYSPELTDLSLSEGTSGTPSAARYVRSPALLGKSPGKGSGRSGKQVLDATDTGKLLQNCRSTLIILHVSVPIYDARSHQFDYANDLDHVEAVLPLYEAEIPPGSFAVVAYTASTYKKGTNFHLTTNVQFVILVKDFE